MKITGSHQVGLCTAATDIVVGILQNKPQGPGAAATVGIFGVSNVVAAAADRRRSPRGAGRRPAGRSLDATNGRWQALEAATAADELIPVLRVR